MAMALEPPTVVMGPALHTAAATGHAHHMAARPPMEATMAPALHTEASTQAVAHPLGAQPPTLHRNRTSLPPHRAPTTLQHLQRSPPLRPVLTEPTRRLHLVDRQWMLPHRATTLRQHPVIVGMRIPVGTARMLLPHRLRHLRQGLGQTRLAGMRIRDMTERECAVGGFKPTHVLGLYE